MTIRDDVEIHPTSYQRNGSPLAGLPISTRYLWEVDDTETDADKYPIRTIFQLFYPMVENDPSIILSKEQRKAASAISQCKTGGVGFTGSYCEHCGKVIIHNASCNNRNCPNCQSIEEKIWVKTRKAETIEGITYHHSVCTIPSELYPIALANKGIVYNLMLKCAPDSIVSICRRKFGFTPGVISVFHSWKSDLGFHPHVHLASTDAGLTADKKFINPETKVLESGEHFLFAGSVLAEVFKYSFMSALNAEYDAGHLKIPSPEACEGRNLLDPFQWMDFSNMLYNKKWVAYSKETFNDHGDAIEYFGRYTHRTAITNNRIISVVLDEEHPEGEVKFWYRDYKNNSEHAIRTVTGKAFVRMFLVHVLPTDFTRIRYSGILANAVKAKNLQLIAELTSSIYAVSVFVGKTVSQALPYLIPNYKEHTCPCCGGSIKQLGRLFNEDLIIRQKKPLAG